MSYYENREDTTWEEIESFCRCLGVTKLIHILKRLCRTPAYRSGLPDCAGRCFTLRNETKNQAQNVKNLSVWSSKSTNGEYWLIEVKAPNDKLSYAQKCWLKFFVSKGLTPGFSAFYSTFVRYQLPSYPCR